VEAVGQEEEAQPLALEGPQEAKGGQEEEVVERTRTKPKAAQGLALSGRGRARRAAPFRGSSRKALSSRERRVR
jgi:hypothetical protein